MFIIDFPNKITSYDSIPDPLRAELGSYYYEDENGDVLVTDSFSTGKIADSIFNHGVDQDNSRLKPRKSTSIAIKGSENSFRNQFQWGEFIRGLIPTGQSFLDHKCNITLPSLDNSGIQKNFHAPFYEDASKLYPSKHLINYNLKNYLHLDSASDELKNIASLKTRFDMIDPTPLTIMQQFSERVINFTGSMQTVSNKQSSIFILHKDDTDRQGSSDYPYHVSLDFNTSPDFSSGFNKTLRDNNKVKNLFKNINSPLNFFINKFFIDNQYTEVKTYDIFDIMTKKSISQFNESENETFLLEQEEMVNLQGNSFFEGIEALYFLADMRDSLESKLRNIEQVYESTDHESFFLGYKIEKYINNDLGNPIQTYYTINDKFTDTQLRYGSKYIYKTKALYGIFGSSYTYKGVSTSEDPQDTNESGAENPFKDEKYWCVVDVETQPSFKLVEIEISKDQESFIDAPVFSPIVEIYSRKNEPMVHFLLRPRGFNVPFEASDPNQEIDLDLAVLKESDRGIYDYIYYSNSSYSKSEYFTGIYEVFMIEQEPTRLSDFANKLLITVDDRTGLVYPENWTSERVSYDNLNAFFSQKLVLNKKYYYVFRALTYHGTPSECSPIYEIELQKNSNEYSVKHREYVLDEDSIITYSKPVKRIFSIEPNYERLIMSTESTNILDNETDGASLTSLVDGAIPQVFKIRLTSRHTGKKIDLNFRFKIVKDGTFTN